MESTCAGSGLNAECPDGTSNVPSLQESEKSRPSWPVKAELEFHRTDWEPSFGLLSRPTKPPRPASAVHSGYHGTDSFFSAASVPPQRYSYPNSSPVRDNGASHLITRNCMPRSTSLGTVSPPNHYLSSRNGLDRWSLDNRSEGPWSGLAGKFAPVEVGLSSFQSTMLDGVTVQTNEWDSAASGPGPTYSYPSPPYPHSSVYRGYPPPIVPFDPPARNYRPPSISDLSSGVPSSPTSSSLSGRNSHGRLVDLLNDNEADGPSIMDYPMAAPPAAAAEPVQIYSHAAVEPQLQPALVSDDRFPAVPVYESRPSPFPLSQPIVNITAATEGDGLEDYNHRPHRRSGESFLSRTAAALKHTATDGLRNAAAHNTIPSRVTAGAAVPKELRFSCEECGRRFPTKGGFPFSRVVMGRLIVHHDLQ
ncbi:hypothetical protein HDU93_006172 [Gonapodya sp. JEL0774]|nr:hypothetical protein HDU93_006172 [Gonapodya sp. JEL0774]